MASAVLSTFPSPVRVSALVFRTPERTKQRPQRSHRVSSSQSLGWKRRRPTQSGSWRAPDHTPKGKQSRWKIPISGETWRTLKRQFIRKGSKPNAPKESLGAKIMSPPAPSAELAGSPRTGNSESLHPAQRAALPALPPWQECPQGGLAIRPDHERLEARPQPNWTNFPWPCTRPENTAAFEGLWAGSWLRATGPRATVKSVAGLDAGAGLRGHSSPHVRVRGPLERSRRSPSPYLGL